MRTLELTLAVCGLIGLGSCKVKPAPPPETSAPAKAAPPQPTQPLQASGASASTSGLRVKHNVEEFSGTYDNVFAQLSTADNRTVIAFVRDCPALTCEAGAWSPGQVALVCPKGFVATITVPGLKPGKQTLDLGFAGPAANASTATLSEVQLVLTKLDNEGVEGSLTQDTTESSVTGSFKARVCPLT